MFEFLIAQAPYAHLYILGLFFLAGFNVPVSEDVLFIAAAIISVTVVPENTTILFISCFVGAYGSDVICYWLGRTFGVKIVKVKPFNKLINEKRLTQMMNFYHRFGALTLLLGRFIPFGVRNAIFLTSGISKMPFLKFASLDLIACSITSAILFSLGRSFANNYEKLFEIIKQFNIVIAAVLAVGIIAFFLMKRKKTDSAAND